MEPDDYFWITFLLGVIVVFVFVYVGGLMSAAEREAQEKKYGGKIEI